MTLAARLKPGETLGDRVMKVDHAGELCDEQAHHDLSAARLESGGWWPKLINPVVAASTEAVIWLGTRL